LSTESRIRWYFHSSLYITSHKTAGIVTWSANKFTRALHQGVAPDDRDALIDYIRALPAIENRIGD